MSTQSHSPTAVVWEWDWCLLWCCRIWHPRERGASLAIIEWMIFIWVTHKMPGLIRPMSHWKWVQNNGKYTGYRFKSRVLVLYMLYKCFLIILHTDGLNFSALPWHQCPRTLPLPLQMWGSFSSQSWLYQRNTPPRVHPHSQSNRWPFGRAKRSKRRNKGRALSLPPSWIFPEGRVTPRAEEVGKYHVTIADI